MKINNPHTTSAKQMETECWGAATIAAEWRRAAEWSIRNLHPNAAREHALRAAEWEAMADPES